MKLGSYGWSRQSIILALTIFSALVALIAFVWMMAESDSADWLLLIFVVSLLVLITLLLTYLFQKFFQDFMRVEPPSEALGPQASYSLPIYSKSGRPYIDSGLKELLEKNRKEKIADLEEHFKGDKRAVIITGAKGVGKSTLAVYFADEDDFWLDFIGKIIDLKTLLIILAQWLGDEKYEAYISQCREVGEAEIENLCDRFAALEHKLFFDNLESLLDKNTLKFTDSGISLFFNKLLRTTHRCRVVTTSRLMPVLDEGIEMEHAGCVAKVVVEGLKEEEGAEILKGHKIKYESEDQLREISREVDGNPLLLNALPPLVKKSSAGETVTDLEQWRRKYSGEILEAVLMEEAPKAGRELISRMCIVPDPLTIVQLRVLFEGGKADDVVDDLVGRSLLLWDRHRKLYELHPAVKETAVGWFAKKPRLLRSAHESALKVYLNAARGLKPREKWKSVGDCYPFVRAAELLIALGEFERAFDVVAKVLYDPLERWGQWHLLARLYEGLIDLWNITKRKPKGFLRMYAEILNNYGILVRSLGDVQKSIGLHETQLDICRKISDRRGEGAAYGNLGIAHDSLGEYRKAIEYHEKRLEIAQEIGDRRGEGNAYGNLGNAYQSLGEYRKAIEYHEKALEIDVELENKRGIGEDYGNLGNAWSKLEKHEKALDYYRKALLIQEEIGDALGMAISHGHIAEEELHFGQNSQAASNAVSGLLIAVSIRVPQAFWLASLTSECREKLGTEEFSKTALETVGEEKAGIVAKILDEYEKIKEQDDGSKSDANTGQGNDTVK